MIPEPRSEPKEGIDFVSCDCENTYLCIDDNAKDGWDICEFCEDCGSYIGSRKITKEDMEAIYNRSNK